MSTLGVLRFESTQREREREREAPAEKEFNVHVLACVQLLMSYTVPKSDKKPRRLVLGPQVSQEE